MSFSFVPNWKAAVVDNPLDARMAEAMRVAVEAARSAAHVVTGRHRASIGGVYNQATKTIQLHADMPYSAIEEMRGGSHAALAMGASAIARVFGGPAIEIHFPNAAPAGRSTTPAMHAARERAWRRGLGFTARRKTKVVVRRWHRRYPESPEEQAGLIL